MDFTAALYASGGIDSVPEGWNLSAIETPLQISLNASAHGDIPTILKENVAMNQIANNQVMYLWTFYPESFDAMTSNVNGFVFNPSIYDIPFGYYYDYVS